MTTPNTQLVKAEEKQVAFVPFGGIDPIKLSVSIIQNLVATPTKSGRTCDPKQAMKFIMLCQAQRLNPFAGDAYLIGYDGKDGPQFSLITAHQAFLKRAEASKDFDGMESGVIVREREGESLHEFEGDYYDEGKFELVGAWAKVHHKQRKFPTVRKGAIKTYRKPYGLWASPENVPMMLVKCVEADALRSTFPTLLGGLYAEGETIQLASELASERAARLVSTTAIDVGQVDNGGGEQQRTTEPAKPKSDSPQAQLAAMIEGYTFDQFKEVVHKEYPAIQIDTLSSVDEITAAHCKVLLRAKDGILAELAALKGGAQ